MLSSPSRFLFFFNDKATTELYDLSLHAALPIFPAQLRATAALARRTGACHRALRDAERRHGRAAHADVQRPGERSEEHTSELQSRLHLVCRLLLEKKKKTIE